MSAEQVEAFSAYSACDVADALLKLGVPGAGFLPDIKAIPTSPSPPSTIADGTIPTTSPPRKLIARASTALFIAKNSDSFPEAVPPLAAISQSLSTGFSNIPSGTPYADLTTPDTIFIISQPQGQSCAVVGGIMAQRMVKLGAKGIVVDGRVRDLDTLRGLNVPIWTKGTSIVGAAGESKAWAVNVQIYVGGVSIEPGDLVMIDPTESGIVIIPRKAVDAVLRMLPKMVEADEMVMAMVVNGGEVGEAFRRFRG
ncbi:hypothetical protein FKW77_000411 [Venturia effusa]|uniref:DlpA domain-containing protein n=1 Tax=Venturia effusa TaxID=50376 RepID=A0A517LGC4_9PEZI|nr:hypothetical protein FKW77_000411 [Venturia effusa]